MSDHTVSLVIPGRNCAATIRPCLEAVCAIMAQPDSALREILFVDDGSTDETPRIASIFAQVTTIRGEGRGAGHARNLGWRTAAHPLVWFVDSDCIATPSALALLVPHLADHAEAAAISGSYDNARPDSLLACLIHEEIVERHLRMGEEVNFLATFNVLYRREVLEQLGGFDTRFLKGQDAELSFRCAEAGHQLRFERASRVGHYHEDRWLKYLRIQRQQGYWRVWLHMMHRGHTAGDSYSSLTDHVQPPLAMLVLASLPLLALLPWVGWIWIAPVALTIALGLLQLPMTMALVRRTKSPKYLMFAAMSFLRSFWRGIGMSMGTIGYMLRDRQWKHTQD